MQRSLMALVLLMLLVASPVTSSTTQAVAGEPGSPRVRTVFGLGPELHLLPNIGPVGTQVLVIGLGYRARARVNIVYGSPSASFMPQPIATATVSGNGTFRTTFTVSCALVVLNTRNAMHPPRRCPLSPSAPFRAVIIGGFIDHQFTNKRTATEGFIVTG
jgi:hypothetical protein